MPQKHPAQNGHAKGFTRNRWYLDDVTGAYHPESDMVRDWEDRLVFVHDIDEPGTDQLRESFEFPTEQNYPDP